MKTNETYNGWTNYATWRVNLELFDGHEFEEEQTTQSLEEIAENIIFADLNTDVFSYPNELLESYARAFISDVNWYEIAESINQEIKNK